MKRILEFLQETNGQFSSTRLFMLLVVFSCIIDWQYSIWTYGVWNPNWDVLVFTASILGLKIMQKGRENNENQ